MRWAQKTTCKQRNEIPTQPNDAESCSCISPEQLSNKSYIFIYKHLLETSSEIFPAFGETFKFSEYVILSPTKFSEQIRRELEHDWFLFQSVSKQEAGTKLV